MPAFLTTGPTVTQNSPLLPYQWPSPVLIAPTHGGTARVAGPGVLATTSSELVGPREPRTVTELGSM